ncbi:MAG: NAD-dependent epimerase/dehydratase family protein [Rhodocyclaceae bacterium]|nr:NAD-dependent epimerase/dehydratase family protein [Rhodocyclaceae bacterium]MDZ4215944.1 NAD-dependent epimerase/dehydratase family protein [Rhodocyclaceae bacterium]
MHPDENNESRLPLRIALIGAGGFLGTNLARYLGSRVAEVRCFGRRQAFPDALQGFRWITGDTSLDTTEALSEVIADCDAVIHLASTSNPTTADRDISADAQANVIASLRLFDQCVAAGIKRLVFISSGGTVYGIPAHVPIPESAPTLPITAYGVAKLAIEKYLEVYSRLRGLDYRVLRISNLYGPFQTAEKKQGVVAAFLSEAMRGEHLEIWGDGQVVRDYIYVADVAESVLAALQHQGEQRIFNIGSGTGLNLIELIDAMEHLLGRRLQRQFRPGRPVDVPVNILDCMLAKKELGWYPRTDFPDGLRRTAEWLETWHRQQRCQVG